MKKKTKIFFFRVRWRAIQLPLKLSAVVGVDSAYKKSKSNFNKFKLQNTNNLHFEYYEDDVLQKKK